MRHGGTAQGNCPSPLPFRPRTIPTRRRSVLAHQPGGPLPGNVPVRRLLAYPIVVIGAVGRTAKRVGRIVVAGESGTAQRYDRKTEGGHAIAITIGRISEARFPIDAVRPDRIFRAICRQYDKTAAIRKIAAAEFARQLRRGYRTDSQVDQFDRLMAEAAAPGTIARTLCKRRRLAL